MTSTLNRAQLEAISAKTGYCPDNIAAVVAEADAARSASAVACADDLRQGVTAIQHIILDDAAALAKCPGPAVDHLRQAQRAVAAAVRADPETGVGRRRVNQAREAAAQLLAALDKMDDGGRDR